MNRLQYEYNTMHILILTTTITLLHRVPQPEFVVLFQISEIQECKHIHDLFLLRDLNLLGNPIQVTQPFTDHSGLL